MERYLSFNESNLIYINSQIGPHLILETLLVKKASLNIYTLLLLKTNLSILI